MSPYEFAASSAIPKGMEESPHSKDELLAAFRRMLDAEEQAIADMLSGDRLGMHLRIAVSELDWYFYNLARASDPTEDQEEQFYLMIIGARRLIQRALESRSAFDIPTLTLRRDKGTTTSVLEIVANLGFIEHGRRVADRTARGECQITRTPHGFEFTLPPRILDAGFHERAVAAHFRSEYQRMSAERFATSDGERYLQSINGLLDDNVRVWREHFIGYQSDPVLDDHFFALGFEALAQSEGYDTFQGSVEFGGISYQKYCLATAFFLSLSLKHEAFCQALVRKHPDIRLEDILTITCERAGLAESVAEALNRMGDQLEGYTETTRAQARKICNVLDINRSSTKLLSRPGFALPFIIEFSETAYIRSLAGSQMAPAQFMLEALRHHFPGEYDTHQRKREASMQRAIERLLSENFGALEYRRNINLRADGQPVTDIDLVVIEKLFGTVLIVQLKYQDLYGGDFRAEGTRSERLLNEAVRWLSATGTWLSSAGEDRFKSAIGLRKRFHISKVYRLILTRHFAHPLTRARLDGQTAYATWLQFVNAVELMKHNQGNIRTLAGLFKILRSHVVEAPAQEHRPVDPVEFNLRSLRYVVRQEGFGTQ